MGKFRSPRVVPREWVRSPKFESRRGKLLRDGCACAARVKLGMRSVRRVHLTDIWSWYRLELRVGDHLDRSEELVSRCVECDLVEPESLASLGGSAPGVVDGILSYHLERSHQGNLLCSLNQAFPERKRWKGAWKALTSQYAGKDKWEAEIKHQEQLLHTRIWKGQSNFSLENFISQHRNAYVSMQASAEHVQYQLPNEHSRVGFLLEVIQCSDPGR